MLQQLLNTVKQVLHEINVSIEIETVPSDTISAEVDVELVVDWEAVNAITCAEYVWSDFWHCAIWLGDLEFSHTDSSGIAGHRVRGTNTLVWRDQLTFAEVA